MQQRSPLQPNGRLRKNNLPCSCLLQKDKIGAPTLDCTDGWARVILVPSPLHPYVRSIPPSCSRLSYPLVLPSSLQQPASNGRRNGA